MFQDRDSKLVVIGMSLSVPYNKAGSFAALGRSGNNPEISCSALVLEMIQGKITRAEASR